MSTNPRQLELPLTYRTLETPGGRYTLHVIGPRGDLHVTLTLAAAYFLECFAAATARKYLSICMRFVAWCAVSGLCSLSPDSAPGLAAEFLRCQYGAKVRRRGGLYVVVPVAHSASTLRGAVAALIAYCDCLIDHGFLACPLNPLTGMRPFRQTAHRTRADGSSGLFMVKGAPWKLRRIPDPLLRELITQAAIDNRWPAWAGVLAELLFETGSRLGEACALTIGDWAKFGFRGEIDAPSKGSGGRRVKTLVLGRSALERLRLYMDGPRSQLSGHTLADLQAMAARDLRLVADMPLLLNLAGSAPNATVFRDDYWTPAARCLGLLDSPHYARHWFVTNAVAQIEAECGDGPLMDRELDLLCHYMHWRNGEMLYAYGGVRAILARHRAAEARQWVSFELFQRAELRIQRHPDLRRLVGERVP